MEATWLYGFDPGMHFVGLTPNGGAQVRAHARGTVEMLIFDWTDFCAKMCPDSSLGHTKSLFGKAYS